MSNFFEKSDLSRNNAENIISDTLKKCDDGELYLENSKSENILLDDNRIKNSSYSSDLGFGFRAVSDEIVAYSHSNEISKNSLKLSADNGSNYTTATLTALPDFANGIKMAKINDLSVTAGTQLKYKIEFANQSSGSKEARIRGVSLQY